MWCSSCLEFYLIECSTGAEGRPENTADITDQRSRSMCAEDKVTVEREKELTNTDPVGMGLSSADGRADMLHGCHIGLSCRAYCC